MADEESPTTTRNRDNADLAERVADVALLPLAVARRMLPDREIPVYLGVGALAVAGAIEWPVAVGAGLAYAAIKRWTPARHDSVRAGGHATVGTDGRRD